MSSALLNKEDWRVVRNALATSLVMRSLTEEEFREKLLDFEKSGHIVFKVQDEMLTVTGNFFCGLPRWEMLRPIAYATSETLH
jgi:hypothetical protein